MRLIDAYETATKIASLARLARSDQQKALLGRCIYIIEHCKTVDAEPVRPAVWRRKDKEQALFGVEWECTNCHESIALNGIMTPIGNGFKFCPYCGAKMNGGAENDRNKNE